MDGPFALANHGAEIRAWRWGDLRGSIATISLIFAREEDAARDKAAQVVNFCVCILCVSPHCFIQRLFSLGTRSTCTYVNLHSAEIVGIDFTSMMSQFTFNRPTLQIDTGGDADLSRYTDHVLSTYRPLHSLRLAPTCIFHASLSEPRRCVVHNDSSVGIRLTLYMVRPSFRIHIQ